MKTHVRFSEDHLDMDELREAESQKPLKDGQKQKSRSKKKNLQVNLALRTHTAQSPNDGTCVMQPETPNMLKLILSDRTCLSTDVW